MQQAECCDDIYVKSLKFIKTLKHKWATQNSRGKYETKPGQEVNLH